MLRRVEASKLGLACKLAELRGAGTAKREDDGCDGGTGSGKASVTAVKLCWDVVGVVGIANYGMERAA